MLMRRTMSSRRYSTVAPATAVIRRVFHAERSERREKAAGSLVHYALWNTDWVLSQAPLCRAFPAAAGAAGIPFATLLWLVDDEIAVSLLARSLIPRTVAVDDLEGSLPQALDPKPNAAYVIDIDGRVFARVLWSNDLASVREALQGVVAHRPIRNPKRSNNAVPLLRAMGRTDEVPGAAGPQARQDFRHALPPVYGMARLSCLYRPLPLPRRSLAAMATVVAVIGLAGVVSWTFQRKSARA